MGLQYSKGGREGKVRRDGKWEGEKGMEGEEGGKGREREVKSPISSTLLCPLTSHFQKPD